MTMPEPPQQQEDGSQVTTTDNSGGNGGNPAWASVLEGIPSQFHEQVKPSLQEWDRGVQQRFQKVQSDYAPWKPFIEQGIDPEQVNYAIGLANAIQQNPKQVIDAMMEYYGINNGQPQQNQNQGQPPVADDPNLGDIDPRIKAQLDQYKEMQNTMAQILIGKQQEDQARQEDARLDAEYKQLHQSMTQKYGHDFDEQIVNGLAMGLGINIDKAAEEYYNRMAQYSQQQHRPAPSLLGPGGNLPSTRPNIRSMSEKEHNDFAVNYLKAANQQNNG